MERDAIYEEKMRNGEVPFSEMREAFMTEEEIKRIDYYLTKFDEGKADMENNLVEWNEIHLLYKGEREADYEDAINAYVNVMLPNIEGQVASMTDTNITATCKGKGLSDQKFASTADPIISLIMKESKIKKKVKRSARRYLLLGEAYVMAYWDADAFDGFGIAKLKTPANTKIIVDKNIKDIDDLQEAEYIMVDEGLTSIDWARRKFGEETAAMITTGNSRPDFDGSRGDDETSFSMITVWTRNNDAQVLERLQFSYCGVLLSTTPKEQRKPPAEPFYTYVFNRYPIFGTGLYPIEDSYHRFGDGKVLKPIQELINKLYDEIVLAIKFSSHGRTYSDPAAMVNPDEFAESDPSKLILAKNPNDYIKTTMGTGVNQIVFNLLEQLFAKVQEATRFSSLMTGNRTGESMTATQAGIQMQQGNAGIDDKKSDLSGIFSEALSYCLGLCLQFWDTGKALRVAETEDFQWVDAKQLREIPELVPADTNFIDNWKKGNPKASKEKQPKWMNLKYDDDDDIDETSGKPKSKTATKQLEIDIDISLGEGLPTNKMALYNIVLSLASLQLLDEETGQPKPLISFNKVRKMIEETLGIKITDEEVKTATSQVAKAQERLQSSMPGGQPNLNQSANVPGQTMGGNMRPPGGGNGAV